MLDDIAKTRWVSASQESTYELCPKKWGFNKLDRIPQPPTLFTERGLEVHGALEQWEEKGTPIDPETDAGKIAMPGLKFLPPPGTGLTENNFTFESDVATYVGFWDLLIPKPRLYVGSTPIIEVYDYKTTTDFKWMKTFNGLRQDPQAILYAVAALFALYDRWKEYGPEKPGICLTWVYFRANPKKPGSRRTLLWVLPDEEKELPVHPKGVEEEYFGVIRMSELEQRYQKVEDVAAELVEHHRQGHKGADLSANIEGCKAYGGCPYQGDPCVLTTKDMLRGIMAQESAAEKIKARAAQQSGATPSTETAASPPQQTEMTIAQKIAARAKSANSEASPEAKAQAEATVRAAAETPPAGRGETPVNPPEAEKPVVEQAQAKVQQLAQQAQPAQVQVAQSDKTQMLELLLGTERAKLLEQALGQQPAVEQAPARRSVTPESVESFTVTALGLAERVHYASIIAAGLISGAPSLDSIGEDAVAQEALDIVDAITVKAVR